MWVSSNPKAVHDQVPGCLRQINAILSRLPRRGGHHVFHENAFYQGWHFSDKLVGFLLLVHLSLQPCVWHGFDGASRCLWLQDRCEEGVLFVWGSFGFMKCHARIPSYTPSFFWNMLRTVYISFRHNVAQTEIHKSAALLLLKRACSCVIMTVQLKYKLWVKCRSKHVSHMSITVLNQLWTALTECATLYYFFQL